MNHFKQDRINAVKSRTIIPNRSVH